MIDLKNLTISKARISLDSKEFSARELAQAYLDAIAEKNADIHAYLEVFADVLEQADRADAMMTEGKTFPLTGIPFAIKDNILIEGRHVSAASKILENYVASYDATVIKLLKDQGAVFLGRTNMDEFAMGGSTENSAYGVTKNPNDTSRVPGGTSGGSAAAVAGEMALVSLGSDTGGSIRQPASFCGVVGIKGTYGSVSRYGLMSAVSSFDQIGPIARTVADAEIVYNSIKGKDTNDATSVEGVFDTKIKMKIGVPQKFVRGGGVEKEVLEVFDQSIEKFKSLGYEIMDIDLPNISLGLPAYYILNFAEISSNLARYDGIRYGVREESSDIIDTYFKTRGHLLGKEVRRRIMLGAYVLSAGYYDAYYGKANTLRDKIREDYKKAFEAVDCILTPVAPTLPFKIGEKVSDPLSLYLEDVFTVGANLSGFPALSMPGGWTKKDDKDLPVGIHLLGSAFAENTLFDIGKQFETL